MDVAEISTQTDQLDTGLSALFPFEHLVTIKPGDAHRVLLNYSENLFILTGARVRWDGWREKVYTTLERYAAARMGIDLAAESNIPFWKNRVSFNPPVYEHSGILSSTDLGISEYPTLKQLALVAMFVAETPNLAEAKWWYESYKDMEDYAGRVMHTGKLNPVISEWISGGKRNARMTFMDYSLRISEKQNNFRGFFGHNDILPNSIQGIAATMSVIRMHASRLMKEKERVALYEY